MANIAYTIGYTDITPQIIDSIQGKPGSDLNFKVTAKYLGLDLKRENGPLISEAFISLDEDKSTEYFIGVHVPTATGLDTADHWVGVKDLVKLGGKDYLSIASTSKNDKPLDNPSTDRKSKGWIYSTTGEILIPLDQAKEYWTMSRPMPTP